MKRRDIIRMLVAAGFTKRREKSRGPHEIYLKSGFPIIPVPRHTEINELTARNILEKARLK